MAYTLATFPLSCAAAHVAKKRRAAVSNCRAVIFNVIRWTLDVGWRVETGCRSSVVRRV